MLLLPSERIKAEALRLGFSACGLAPAEAVDEAVQGSFRQWIADGRHATMNYLQNHEDKRLDPRLLVEGARTVISVALNYYPATSLPADSYQIASYAYGKDYHDVVKAKLNLLLSTLSALCPGASIQGRAFCDTAPILEKYWAWRCGLGWIGKHTQLIIPRAGSYFFLGELIVDAVADRYDMPQPDRCGACTRCMEACPTQAIDSPFHLDAGRCLSYRTIEHRGALSPETGEKMGKTIYGCDRCLQACPWNRFATPTDTEEFHPSPLLLQMKKEDWHTLTEEHYKTLFKGSAVKRVKYEGLMRNIRRIKGREKEED